MGTRADFYVGRGESAEWIGSIALDGYPSGLKKYKLFGADSEDAFRNAVEELLAAREDATRPEQGWPWPWETSHTTDYAYAFDDGEVHASNFGHSWFDPRQKEPDNEEQAKTAIFPNMKDRQNVTLGKRSGVMVFVG